MSSPAISPTSSSSSPGRRATISDAITAAIAADRHPTSGRIRRLGHGRRPRRRQWLLRHASVLAYPSLDEGFGFPILEATGGRDAGRRDIGVGSIPEVAGDAAVLVDATGPDPSRTSRRRSRRRCSRCGSGSGLIEAGYRNVRRFSLGTHRIRTRRALPNRPWTTRSMTTTVLCGGVGAARFLRGLLEVVAGRLTVTAVVNTGDDTVLHGLSISPDLDTITYTLAGAIDAERGWGLAGETWRSMEALGRYAAVRPAGSAAAPTWFNLGDTDLATHFYRTARLDEGADAHRGHRRDRPRLEPRAHGPTDDRRPLPHDGDLGRGHRCRRRRFRSDVPGLLRPTAPRRRRPIGVRFDHDGAVPTPAGARRRRVERGGRDRSVEPDRVDRPDPRTARRRRPADGATRTPSWRYRRSSAVLALKGPADRMLAELGLEPSVVGVARLYAPVAATLVIDTVDAEHAPAVEATGCDVS